MLKIYPSTFNKFVVFILYGLLSVAVITLAQGQDGCELNDFTPTPNKLKTIGYVQLFANHDFIDSSTIQWNLYDYINIIAYPDTDAPPNSNSQWNGIRYPTDGPLKDQMEARIKEFTAARNNSNPQTKILLSIRNYDPSKWTDGTINEGIVNDVHLGLGLGLDGIDIEYPGMRGSLCQDFNNPINPNGNPNGNANGNPKNPVFWDQSTQDAAFILLLSNLKPILASKILMITVGSNPIIDQNKQLSILINALNIETYHFSLYQYLRDNSGKKIQSYANNPLDKFEEAYNSWIPGVINSNVIEIFMGVDLGNTLQMVDNKDIEDSPSVATSTINFSRSGDFGNNIKAINGLCPLERGNFPIYSFPWSEFQTTLDLGNYCIGSGNNGNLVRKFDPISNTPWLYKSIDQPKGQYEFISYEDKVSLNRKINFTIAHSIKGMSISDISLGDDNNTLITYIRDKPNPTGIGSVAPGATGDPNGQGPGNNSNPSASPSSSTSAISNPSQNKDNRGKIAGGVIGGVFGVAFIAGAGFLWYRNKQKQQNLYGNKNFNYPHTTDQGNPGMVPEDSSRMVPSTTVIPIASGYVTAMFDFEGKEENDLSFKKGDKIEVLERGDGPNDWWVGRVNGTVGEFPGNYVRE